MNKSSIQTRNSIRDTSRTALQELSVALDIHADGLSIREAMVIGQRITSVLNALHRLGRELAQLAEAESTLGPK